MSWANFDWHSHARTDVGRVRKVNEDACLDQGQHGLWVVADGMGGHAAGDVASQLITKMLGELEHPSSMAEFVDQVEQQLLAVNARLLDISARELDNQTIGSTVVCLLAHEDHCAVLWAGDSRAYRLRNGNLTMLIQEHTQAEELVEQGLIAPEDAESHPTFNILTRAVGAQDPLYVDVDIFQVEKGDRFLLCSDGLNKAVTDPEIAEVLSSQQVAESVDTLVVQSLDQGSRDNVTIIVVDAL
ncbi:MAG: serine/threonine-protein phosphatase [Immundisolibacteraceae bacterium]|nr:serine/threonine-protein phosphatase [Immundisolibacteraceae bacterium]